MIHTRNDTSTVERESPPLKTVGLTDGDADCLRLTAFSLLPALLRFVPFARFADLPLPVLPFAFKAANALLSRI